MRLIAANVFLLPVLLFAAGCRTVDERAGRIAYPEYSGSVALAVESNVAVGASRATRYFWGRQHASRPERTFSEMFTRSAGRNAGLSVTAIREEGADHLCCEEGIQQLVLEAHELGMDFLFAAEVDHWSQAYVLFIQWARVDFTLSCYSVDSGELMWTEDVSLRRWYATDRRVLADALSGIFPACGHAYPAGGQE